MWRSRKGISWIESSSSRNEVGQRSCAVAEQRLLSGKLNLGDGLKKSRKSRELRKRIFV